MGGGNSCEKSGQRDGGRLEGCQVTVGVPSHEKRREVGWKLKSPMPRRVLMPSQVLGDLPRCSWAAWVHAATLSLARSDQSTKAGFLSPLLVFVLEGLISVVSQVPVDLELLEGLPHSGYNSSPSLKPSPNNISAWEMRKQNGSLPSQCGS